MEDRDYLSTGIGFLKTLLGTYVLIIVGICYAASRQNAPVAEEPVSIEAEAHDNFTILSCNGKVFIMDTNSYNEFMNSKEETTVLVDTMEHETQGSVISKSDIQELGHCSSYEDAYQLADHFKGLSK